MKMRAMVFEDDPLVRGLLWSALDGKGYEVFTFPHPDSCPLCTAPSCRCPMGAACADIVISDLNMRGVGGLRFVEAQRAKGCKARHFALMSAKWTDAELRRARDLGCKVFVKPFHLHDLYEWLVGVEADADAGRKLANWFLLPDGVPEQS